MSRKIYVSPSSQAPESERKNIAKYFAPVSTIRVFHTSRLSLLREMSSARVPGGHRFLVRQAESSVAAEAACLIAMEDTWLDDRGRRLLGQ